MEANSEEPKNNQTNHPYYTLYTKEFLKNIAKSFRDSYISMDAKSLCQ